VGKTKDSSLSNLTVDFISRIRRFIPLEITELREPKAGADERRVAEEGKAILASLDDSDRVVLLDAQGDLWSSNDFAAFISKHLRQDSRRLTFVIGGFNGVSETVKERAERTWSLSPLTFTHELSRLLVVEQLYRAMAILKGHPYAR